MDDLEAFKQSLQEKIFEAYESGICLPEGRVAFYDEDSHKFVDAATLRPLQGEDVILAADAYDAMTPEEQQKNASYLASRAIYRDAERIEAARAAADFNTATRPQSGEAEPVGDIIRRLFRPAPSLKI